MNDLSPVLCKVCNQRSKALTLSQFGNRCRSCYLEFCIEGVSGGPKGFVGGAADTDQQREMRRRLKSNRPTGQAMTTEADDIRAREQAKKAAAKMYEAYTRAAR